MKLILFTAIFVSSLVNQVVHGSAIGEYNGEAGVEGGHGLEENQNLDGGQYETQEHADLQNNEIEGHNGEVGGEDAGAALEGLHGNNFQEQLQQQWQPVGHAIGGENLGGGELHGELNEGGHGLDSGSNIGELASHGINVGDHGHHGFEGHEHLDLQPKVEVQHDVIPTKTIEHTKPVPINIVKKIGVPVPHPVGVPTPQIIKVPVPEPYAVHIPVPHPIHVPIYKLVPQEIEKRVPIQVEKLVPVYIEKPVKIEIEKHHVEYVDKPYPVHVPVYKHIFHHTGKHHHHH